MPETDTIPVSASVASTGKGIRYIGDHCYAYSGLITTSAGNYVTALDFTSGAGYIASHLELYVDDTTPIGQNDAYGFKIEINGLTVCKLELDDRATPRTRQPHNDINFIIPPLSHVVISLYAESAETNFGTFMLSGRVYGEE